MLVQFLARVTKKLAARKGAPPRSFRPACEWLESREVPATLTYVGNGTYPFMNAVNWSPSQAPANGDDIIFNSSAVNVSAVTSPGIQFNSISLKAGYTGTVTLYTPSTFNEVVLESGNLALTGTDISIAGNLDWTGGTLHSGTSTRTVHILGGAAATVEPASGGTVTLGATLSFESNGTTGSTGTFEHGTIEFKNGADLVVESYCAVQVKPPPSFTLQLTNVDIAGASEIRIKSLGEVAVTSGTYATTDVPISVEGGTLKLIGSSTATFSGAVGWTNKNLPPPPDSASVMMSSGKIRIQPGSTLKGVDALEVRFSGGTLETLKNGDGVQPDAVIDSDLTNTGADVVILQDMPNRKPTGASTCIFGKLKVTGTCAWSGGTFRPVVYAPGGNTDLADRWHVVGKFTITGGAGKAKIAPGTVDAQGNPNTQQPAVGQNWTIITSDTQIAHGEVFPTVDGNWVLVEVAGNPPKTWQVQGKAA